MDFALIVLTIEGSSRAYIKMPGYSEANIVNATSTKNKGKNIR